VSLERARVPEINQWTFNCCKKVLDINLQVIYNYLYFNLNFVHVSFTSLFDIFSCHLVGWTVNAAPIISLSVEKLPRFHQVREITSASNYPPIVHVLLSNHLRASCHLLTDSWGSLFLLIYLSVYHIARIEQMLKFHDRRRIRFRCSRQLRYQAVSKCWKPDLQNNYATNVV
jgi:hypothetical protein